LFALLMANAVTAGRHGWRGGDFSKQKHIIQDQPAIEEELDERPLEERETYLEHWRPKEIQTEIDRCAPIHPAECYSKSCWYATDVNPTKCQPRLVKEGDISRKGNCEYLCRGDRDGEELRKGKEPAEYYGCEGCEEEDESLERFRELEKM